MSRAVVRGLACALAVGLAGASMIAAVRGASAACGPGTCPTVFGAGSTWVQIALDQWRADIAKQGFSINYQGTGSSTGRNFYIINQVDFAASEIPFQPDETPKLQGENKSWQYLPDVAGGTSLMYNLHSPSGQRITSLNLNADTAGKIFTGAISNWQDAEIRQLNPGVSISETSIIPVVRSDGSGTSAQFSLYLANQAAGVWQSFVNNPNGGCPAPCSVWPQFPGSQAQSGSDGVANFVANDAIGSGAIGYVEAGYAYGREFPLANMQNASGNFTQPVYTNVSTALAHAKLNADLTQNLTGVYAAPEPSAYPMSSYSYMITPTSGLDPGKGFVLGTWIIYIACHGQTEAAPLGYSPLPPNLVQADFEAVRRIPGAPAPPPVDAAHCDNPTITGALQQGPKGFHGSTVVSSRGGGGGPAASAAATSGTTPGATASNSASAAANTPGVLTLNDSQRLALFRLAEQNAKHAGGAPVLPLILAAALILVAAFGPVVFEWRPRPSIEGGGHGR